MFYEGSEKRLEITTSLNLLEFANTFWQEMVRRAGAYIISQVENNHVKAFLLSESSLFVWKNRLLLITCGETHLLQASLYFQKKVNRNEIVSLLFQRHQPYYPEKQKTNFQYDCLQLQKSLKGSCRHWSEDYCGDIFIFGNNQQTSSTKNILMLHGLKGELFDLLHQGSVTTSTISKQLQLSQYFSQFNIDQFSFDPKGYSLNAIDSERYLTLHITPEKQSSYISFESNLPDHKVAEFQKFLLSLFTPQRAYLMTFSPSIDTLNIQTKTISAVC